VPHPVTGQQEIRREVEEILENLLPLDAPLNYSTLCHYTSLSVTLLILDAVREDILLSECRYCNDREEFAYAFKAAIDSLEKWPNKAFARPYPRSYNSSSKKHTYSAFANHRRID
jgi:hypothetical protein